ncbi:MAG TPA: 4-(cytidine 5'-diphospho)-2-C-methyl-D-erythritol kinase [Candidatus Kapabacteria bacterium]|jgi:4-diphosphocytidyl-2-C-methyl-D-erythritol kinase|nr:4-(cytidine 5'-diphospho)-2-C-methyl-D-erythritol kinase [Candidatus Kapabacteria bacterium]
MHKVDRYVAYAKINLGLEVLGRRVDGYHELNTLFYRVMEPHDSISVEQSDIFRLTCSDSALPVDSRNLIMRAAEKFAERFGVELPSLHIHLEKHIPTAAGLGGGSSDAAVMLEILCDQIEKLPATSELMEIAASIGADVSFFLSGEKAAVAHGIGEKLAPMELELGCSILIVKDPAIQISTREAYEGIHHKHDAKATDYFTSFEVMPSIATFDRFLRNDFEPSAFERYPKLAEIKEALYVMGASFALMSGSGSALFGLFEDRIIAEQAREYFADKGMLTFLEY